ncbi:hypothetical protein DFH07DRAFT_829727 [Mycena maculata]|uniref:F-box domain-containing protein n=1 Tax=Mycena maculata TaxID=230809 RepID=A0AAD7N6I2_9AGAR|nr:hypothetical protein DFH07DRAFT_829727 [Mycena maculata]
MQRAVLKSLEHNKRLVQRQLNSVRHPVSRLPPEISSEIFIQSLPPSPQPGARRAPILFLNICNKWTDIALSTPALWAAIRVVFPRADSFKKILGVWLKCAQNHS